MNLENLRIYLADFSSLKCFGLYIFWGICGVNSLLGFENITVGVQDRRSLLNNILFDLTTHHKPSFHLTNMKCSNILN